MAEPHESQRTGQVVFTNKARCRDCYRCLRACPVKAIRIVGTQAFVDADRCIACGTCIRECPQGAKSFRNDVSRAASLVEQGGTVAATVAPSFAAFFSDEEQRRLPDALRRLGFTFVAETSVGAYSVASATSQWVKRHPGQANICTACPAAVTYVEKYAPDLIPALVPVLSPMLAHARQLKERLGRGTAVVFIGPCVAKKTEAERPEHAGVVDCAITFTELQEWFESKGISVAECGETPFDEAPEGDARFFPVPGGLAKTAAMDTDLFGAECLAVSGVTEFEHALDRVRSAKNGMTIEPLFCPQGCVNGPGIPRDANIFERRGNLLHYAAEHMGRAPDRGTEPELLETHFAPEPLHGPEFSEDEIRAVLARTGKANPEDQLNCGACGYASCEEQAKAVLRGMAVPEMCIPYMRRLAEQRSDKIIESTPNGIVILDEHLNVLHMNPAFRAMFMCTDAVLGKRISYLMDPEPFERIAQGEVDRLELTARHDSYSLICHEIIYRLPGEKQYVGVLVNITNSTNTEAQLKSLRSSTVHKAQELLEHQIEVAQRMAQFLGESTARSEELSNHIKRLARENPEQSGDNWLWDTDTSK